MKKLTLFTLVIYFCSCTTQAPAQLKASQYLITSANNNQSIHWANYAFNHLQSRTSDKSAVMLGTLSPAVGSKCILIEVSGKLKNDYCTRNTKDTLFLTAKNDRTMLWVVYQLIENIADVDNRFSAKDLPPASIHLNENICRNFDFEYREPLFPLNLQPEFAPIIGTNSIDIDWGLWGHNIGKAISNTSDKSIYAWVSGKRNTAQFCFSSPLLYNQLVEFIIDNYGDNTDVPINFMILPQDNDLVCMDENCQKLGNTPTNASPAVSYLINKLANRFPNYRFYTTAYRTTTLPPTQAPAANTGVFISAIDLPKGVAPSLRQPETRQFLKTINAWHKVMKEIYVWDYAANFDDYLTPIPILYNLPNQLQFYKEHGVKGILLEGSDYDYSSFGDLKAYVSSVLMMNIKANIDSLSLSFLKKEYPTSFQLLYKYYTGLEKDYKEKNMPYDIYGGTDGALHSYLNKNNFESFYQKLGKIIAETEGEEQNRLRALYTALSFTRLQIAYFSGAGDMGYANLNQKSMIVKPEVQDWLTALKHFSQYKNMSRYRETDGKLTDYCQYWSNLIAASKYENQLIGIPLKNIPNNLGTDSNISLLNDGTPGFENDYHQGWYICKSEETIDFSTKDLQGQKQVNLRFLIDTPHHLLPPDKIEVYVGNNKVKTLMPADFKSGQKTTTCSFNISLSHSQSMQLKIYAKNTGKTKWACDEIQIINDRL